MTCLRSFDTIPFVRPIAKPRLGRWLEGRADGSRFLVFENNNKEVEVDEVVEESVGTPMGDEAITDDDKLWSLLSYIFSPLVGIIVLLLEDKKDRPFVKYNAVVSVSYTHLTLPTN